MTCQITGVEMNDDVKDLLKTIESLREFACTCGLIKDIEKCEACEIAHTTAISHKARFQSALAAKDLEIDSLKETLGLKAKEWARNSTAVHTCHSECTRNLCVMRRELDEQCRINGMGAQRELKLMTQLKEEQTRSAELLKYVERLENALQETISTHEVSSRLDIWTKSVSDECLAKHASGEST